MRVGWVSDVHLNFLDPRGGRRFLRELADASADVWLLGGDIGEARSVVRFLHDFDATLPGRTYFVLGNHDFYGGGFSKVRKEVRALVAESKQLVWLTGSGLQKLSGAVALVGDDSWADARLGNPLFTPVELTDFFAIEDLYGLTRRELVWKLRETGDGAASRLKPKLEEAAAMCTRVLVLTHVPPFREAAWHEGRLCNDDWVPWFSCSAVGEVLLACALGHPRVSFLVLCGHTHSSGVCSPAPNLSVWTAHADYGVPEIQRILDLRADSTSQAW